MRGWQYLKENLGVSDLHGRCHLEVLLAHPSSLRLHFLNVSLIAGQNSLSPMAPYHPVSPQ